MQTEYQKVGVSLLQGGPTHPFSHVNKCHSPPSPEVSIGLWLTTDNGPPPILQLEPEPAPAARNATDSSIFPGLA